MAIVDAQVVRFAEKILGLGYPDYEVRPGEDEIPMLHVENHFICSVDYALSLSDEDLGALITETLEVGREKA